MPADDDNSLDEEDRARLHAALERSATQLQAGEGIPADETLHRIKKQ